jgi:hypothetical protein
MPSRSFAALMPPHDSLELLVSLFDCTGPVDDFL